MSMMWYSIHIATTLVGIWGVVLCEQCTDIEVGDGNNRRIHSDNFPQDYPGKADQCWLVSSSHSSLRAVTITFNQFATENCCDKVHIYEDNGDGEYSQRYVLSGWGGQYMSYTLNGLKVTFTSDYTGTEGGWQACLCAGTAECECEWDETVRHSSPDSSDGGGFSVFTLFVPVVLIIVIIVIIVVVIKKRQQRARLSRGVGTATAMQPVQMTHNAQPPPTYPQQPYNQPYPNQPPNQPYPNQPPNQQYPNQPPNQSYPNQPPNQPYPNQPYQNNQQSPNQPYQDNQQNTNQPSSIQPSAPPSGGSQENQPFIACGGSIPDETLPPSYEEATKYPQTR